MITETFKVYPLPPPQINLIELVTTSNPPRTGLTVLNFIHPYMHTYVCIFLNLINRLCNISNFGSPFLPLPIHY